MFPKGLKWRFSSLGSESPMIDLKKIFGINTIKVLFLNDLLAVVQKSHVKNIAYFLFIESKPAYFSENGLAKESIFVTIVFNFIYISAISFFSK